jgi:WG containing repeat
MMHILYKSLKLNFVLLAIVLNSLIFSGFALAADVEYPSTFSEMVKDVSLYGYRTKNDGVLIKPRFSYAGDFAKNGLAVACTDQNGVESCGYIDIKGEFVIASKYKIARDFTTLDFPAPVLIAGETKYGYINEKGISMIAPKFDFAASFSNNGLALVGEGESDEGRKYGYINKNGEYIIPPKFKNAEKFPENGLAYATLAGSKVCGYINVKGETVIQPQFSECGTFRLENLRTVYLAKVQDSNKKFGLIDATGKIVVPVKFDELLTQNDVNGVGVDYIYATLNGKKGVLNFSGNEIIKPEHIGINFNQVSNGFYAYTNSDKDITHFGNAEGCITSKTTYSTDLTPCIKMRDAEIIPARMQENGEAQWMIWLFLNSPIQYGVLQFILGIFGALVGFGGVVWTVIRKKIAVFKYIRHITLARWIQSFALVLLSSFLLGIFMSETHTDRNPADFTFYSGFLISFIAIVLFGMLFALVVFISRKLINKVKK